MTSPARFPSSARSSVFTRGHGLGRGGRRGRGGCGATSPGVEPGGCCWPACRAGWGPAGTMVAVAIRGGTTMPMAAEVLQAPAALLSALGLLFAADGIGGRLDPDGRGADLSSGWPGPSSRPGRPPRWGNWAAYLVPGLLLATLLAAGREFLTPAARQAGRSLSSPWPPRLLTVLGRRSPGDRAGRAAGEPGRGRLRTVTSTPVLGQGG